MFTLSNNAAKKTPILARLLNQNQANTVDNLTKDAFLTLSAAKSSKLLHNYKIQQSQTLTRTLHQTPFVIIDFICFPSLTANRLPLPICGKFNLHEKNIFNHVKQ